MNEYDFSFNPEKLPHDINYQLNELAKRLFLYDKDMYYKKSIRILNNTKKQLIKLFKKGR